MVEISTRDVTTMSDEEIEAEYQQLASMAPHSCGEGGVANCQYARAYIAVPGREVPSYYGGPPGWSPAHCIPVCISCYRKGVPVAATKFNKAGKEVITADMYATRAAAKAATRETYYARIRILIAARAARQEEKKKQDDAGWQQKYAEHLASPYWRELRKKVFARDKGLCQGCLVRPATRGHHLTYARLGHELACDIVSLCEVCHTLVHGRPC